MSPGPALRRALRVAVGGPVGEAMRWAATRPMSRLTPDGGGLHKRRNALGSLAALSTRAFPARFVLLSGDAWWARESELYAAFYGLRVERRPRGALWLPRLPGGRLDHAVARLDHAGALRVSAAAMRELTSLHGLPEHTGDGSTRPFSHGDATARNALYDDASGSVSFFDFETMHPPALSLDERRADDVLALAASLAVALGPWSFRPLAALACSAHEGTLRGAIAALLPRDDLATRARAPMPDAGWSRWLDAVRGALRLFGGPAVRRGPRIELRLLRQGNCDATIVGSRGWRCTMLSGG